MRFSSEMLHQYIDDNDDEGADNCNRPCRLPDGALPVPDAIFRHEETLMDCIGHATARFLLALGVGYQAPDLHLQSDHALRHLVLAALFHSCGLRSLLPWTRCHY